MTPSETSEPIPVSDEKVAQTLENSGTSLKTDTDEVARRLELSEKRAYDREKNAEAREERREKREWWMKIILSGLTLVGAVYARSAHITSVATHEAVNSRLDKVIERVEKASFAEGVLKGKEDEK